MLDAGTQLGPYRILSKLGAGGMGEVYLSRDTRLAREVALKVLPRHLAETPEARARFEREARAISSLNHPHICALHDVGRENGIDFLVLEKIAGETLAARLARGALPLEQVLRLGSQIADALDCAHRGGLVHRDLKPGNVMIAKNGAKLMDFGLARPAGFGSVGASAATTVSPSEAQPLTDRGTFLGTFQYMAPEQLEGKEADERSDLWALGCVLYEMATGKRAFEGKSQASLVSAIMSSEPQRMSQLAPLTPASLDRLVSACLSKDPDERIQSAHDVKLLLKWIAENGVSTENAITAGRSRWLERALWVGVAVVIAAVGFLGTRAFRRTAGDRDPVRFLVKVPAGQVAVWAPRISPDGRMLAFAAADSTGVQRLWLRQMGSLEALPLAGTERSRLPFWSPDSKNLAFVSGGKLLRVPVAGGAVVTLAEVGDNRTDGSWGSSGTILLDGGRGDSLIAVPAAGGSPRPVSRFDRAHGDLFHACPRFLPDGQHFLYVAYRQPGGQPTLAIMLGRLGSFEVKELGPCTGDIELAPPNGVLYVNGTSLVRQLLDVKRGVLTGDPVSVAEGLPPQPSGVFSAGGSSLAVTNVSGAMSELWWMDRAGRPLSRVAEPDRYREIALSPDARRAAVSIEDPISGFDDVWVRDLERGISTRLTFDRTQETCPIWSLDGSRILYSSDRQGGNYLIYSIPASGGGAEDTLSVGNSGQEGPMSFTPDGQSLVTSSTKGTTWDWDVMIRDGQGREAPRPFCTSPSLEWAPTMSPDGRWLAYCSDETGRPEIYVRSFPDGLRKWRVSRDGGSIAAWSRNGAEIIYQNPTNDLIAVPIAPGAEFLPGNPVKLFHADVTQYGWVVHRWAVTADGERFLVNQKFKNPLAGITVTRNWESSIERLR